MSKIDAFFKLVKKELSDHSPEILTGLGIAGMFSAVIFSIRATPKARDAIEKKKQELNKKKLTIPEAIGASWKYYIPTAASFAVGTACIIGSDNIAKKRTAALAAAYSITETALTEYKDKVREVVGENKEDRVYDKISEEQVKKDPPKSNEIVFVTKDGILFREPITKRYFQSTSDIVGRAEVELNRDLLNSGFISMNDVFYMLGLEMTDDIMDEIGWDANHEPIEFVKTPVAIGDDQVCWAIQYRYPPQHKSKFA